MKNLDIRDFAENQAGYTLLDVREPDEFADGHIPGATNLPLSEFNVLAPKLDRTRPYALVCASGNRSGMAADAMARAGFDVTNLIGGMALWPLATTTN